MNDDTRTEKIPNKILSQNEKYRKAHEILVNLAEIISEKPMGIFSTYLEILQKFQQFINNDTIFSVEAVNNLDDNINSNENNENTITSAAILFLPSTI